ncbi:phosphate ABC transporter substrate-binding protein PstS [Desulfomonile tiedjei]|uniref:Phosphate-binding protein n=1 Tax=Desulfomonile tiedjei (strain ATCC 49306 / DSM 6799 / DCB-1) TaxID=706587 RepID=I4CDN1_DESTA|nr:phosphate ABC transporter substrate-binding protein PstS [Desulfomonile tiedjei]AFM27672.1 phosphate ABC transporter substrate-binding protein, PhoT family [Desulfomonile tiedjei DSM 6799]
MEKFMYVTARGKRASWAMTAAIALAFMACLALSMTAVPRVFAAEVESVSGAGASFPYPVYSKWGNSYSQISGLKINYQSIGSGGGIAQIKAKSVDFGASDEPMKAAELDKEGLIQFPMIMGGVVPVVNIEGVRRGKLRLTPELISDIYLGKIKSWNDRRILAVNPDLKLPDEEITVVHRADGSGTTWIFTTYLTEVSEEWKSKIGSGKTVSWPTGLGAKGNEGVSSLVAKTSGSIGYVEFAYALKQRLKYALLQNSTGRFISPTIEAFQSSCANADWKNAAGFYMVLVNQPGEKSWPITGASYILVHKDQADAQKAKALLKFFDWCFKNGAQQAISLHYVPIPDKVYDMVESNWKKEISSSGQPVWETKTSKRGE